MLTKEQKKEQVALASDSIKNSQSVLFVDFSGVSDEAAKQLKKELREKGASMKVLKKRLLSIALKDAGIEFDTMQEKTPLATIFSESELVEVAGLVHKFGKQFKDTDAKFNVLGVYDKEAGKMVSQKDFLVIANLPSKEVLIAQVMGGITGPARAFMSIVSQLSEKKAEEEKAEKAEAEAEKAKAEEAKKKAPVKEEAAADAASEETAEKAEELKDAEAPLAHSPATGEAAAEEKVEDKKEK